MISKYHPCRLTIKYKGKRYVLNIQIWLAQVMEFNITNNGTNHPYTTPDVMLWKVYNISHVINSLEKKYYLI